MDKRIFRVVKIVMPNGETVWAFEMGKGNYKLASRPKKASYQLEQVVLAERDSYGQLRVVA